jgi:NAD-dependent dihydropyrimidine dehydrogenase PreA subunit
MSYTIVSDVCTFQLDCIPVCPVECIHKVEDDSNTQGTHYCYIDETTCIDCGACLSVCPVEGAILDDWQADKAKRHGPPPGTAA